MSLTFLHLSDIHFSKFSGDHYDLDTELRDALARDAVALTRRFPDPTTGILVTGDIAFSGSPLEYSTARNWLESLCDRLHVDKANVWVTPGNHDVNRGIATHTHSLKALHDRLRNADPTDVTPVLQTLYRNPVDSLCLFSPLTAYNDFAKAFGCEIGPHRPVWKTEERLDDDLLLKLWGLNSVILSDANDTPRTDGAEGSLVLGAFQIPIATDNDLHLVLCHHPPEWLKDEVEVARRLKSHVRIQLFGHTHSHRLDADEQTLRLVAGAVHPGRRGGDWCPAYNILTLTADTRSRPKALIATVWPRVWDNATSSFVSNATADSPYHGSDCSSAPV